MQQRWYRFAIRITLLFIAYYVTARVGLTINAVSGFATLIWAPTGIALATLLLLGYKYWPGITTAAFFVNLATGAKPLVALGIAVGNTVEPLLGAFLLNRIVKFQRSMETVKDVFGLVLLAGVFSTIASATIGVTSLWFGNVVSTNAIRNTWIAWWVGDLLGVLVFAPLILLMSQRLQHKLSLKRSTELLCYLVVLAGISMVSFRGVASLNINPLTLAYLIFPLMIWIVLRFGQIGSAAAMFVTSLVAIWATVVNFDVSSGTLSHRLLLLQTYMGVAAITFMTLAAVVSEREKSQRLKEKFARRARTLTNQRSRLMALSQAKDEFISLASHQLRTPATSVKQYTAMLLENYAGELTLGQRALLEKAYEGNERQLQFIDLLLRVAQLDAGNLALKKESVDLTTLLQEIIQSLNDDIKSKQQSINFTHDKRDIYANVDKEKMRFILENLIANASNFSSPGKKIDIKLKQDRQQTAILVKDSGVGIIQKDYKKLFSKFTSINSPLSENISGTGLGLYWAKKVIAMHRGSIKVESKPRKGSTFTITIPNSANKYIA